MPPAKAKAHDEGSAKEKNGTLSSAKMRRGASQQSHQAASVTALAAAAAAAAAAQAKEAESAPPSIQWSSFDREVLHNYRRQHRLNTPASYASSYHHMVLSQPGGIGLHSPTMIRKKKSQRQDKETLAMAVRKHFNGVGIQENDVIVDFIYKIRSENDAKSERPNQQGIITGE